MEKLEGKSIRELLDLAREWGLSGYSKLKKSELVKLLSRKLVSQNGKKAAANKKNPVKHSRVEPATARRAASKARAGKTALAKPAARPIGVRPPEIQKNRVTEPVQPPASPKKQASGAKPAQQQQLPQEYGDGRMGLLARDPFWLYCYWDLTQEQRARLWKNEQPTLRLMKQTSSSSPREVKRIPLSQGARSWYIQVDGHQGSYLAELGTIDKRERFAPLLSSNWIRTPREGVSDKLELVFAAPPSARPSSFSKQHSVQTAVSPRKADQFYALSAGARKGPISSAEMLEGMRHLLQVGLASEQLHSEGLVRDRQPTPAPEDYWLIVDTDLIVYGATVPGSNVTIQNVPVQVDAFGRFWTRYALPDGLLQLPVIGVSPNQRFSKKKHIQVQRQTR